tara:strand:+ start:637 stop:1017 length:381 start_codon:yes stop_codon:yes gene_type:complete
MGLTFKTIDQADAEYNKQDESGSLLVPVSLYILEIVERISTDQTNATILNEFLTYLQSQHRKKVEGAMQQNKFLTKKIHNPDGFYIDKFAFESWANDNSKTIQDPTRITSIPNNTLVFDKSKNISE